MRKFKRIYHPYYLWEEVQSNMWGDVCNKQFYINRAKYFISHHKIYGFYMMRVVTEWKYSCENALTDNLLNRKAWIGHAACAYALNCPEDIIREAWGYLTNEQQNLANRQADRAIRYWEENRIKNIRLYQFMEKKMLWKGHT